MTDQSESVPTATRPGEANLFNITGPITVSYSRSSFSGAPLLSYTDAEHSLNFSDDEITRVNVAVGER